MAPRRPRPSLLLRRLRRRQHDEQGYVAVLVAILLVPLVAMAAFTVDVGQWYVTAREAQRAADAAALAGVPHLPGDLTKAFATAQTLAADNGFNDSADDIEVSTAIGNAPTQLGVTVTRTVPNQFGRLLGIPETTISRTAVADYAGPVPLGSPCNLFGNDPEGGHTSSVCEGVGQFWANIGAPKAVKGNGDAYQNGVCDGSHGCLAEKNLDYDSDGYFYSITLTKDVSRLVIDAFDPALIHVGNKCEKVTLSSKVGDRYEKDSRSAYCTGDVDYVADGYKDTHWNARTDGYRDMVATEFTVRDPGPNAWDPTSFPIRTTCEGRRTFPGYAMKNLLSSVQNDSYVAQVFRQWVTLCTIDNAKAGTYLVQVKTNGVGNDLGNGHNRFSLRAYSETDADDNEAIAISGSGKMTIYANAIGATPEFYLARVPNGAAGQILNVELFDVGDISGTGVSGTITVVPPPDSRVEFTECTGTGAHTGALIGCRLDSVTSSRFNKKWQTIAVEIPAGYTCDDLDPTDCWVRLHYDYGAATQPADTTSWAASIQGDPVRLIE